jgi:hypothetical protein
MAAIATLMTRDTLILLFPAEGRCAQPNARATCSGHFFRTLGYIAGEVSART